MSEKKTDCMINEEFKEFKLERTDKPTLKFVGVKIASAESSFNTAAPNYSGTKECHYLQLYKTKSGNFIAVRSTYTQCGGQHDKGEICKTDQEVYDFFGFGWLAKNLYNEAKLYPEEKVE